MPAVFLPEPWAHPRFLALFDMPPGSGAAAILPDHAIFAHRSKLPVCAAQIGAQARGSVLDLSSARIEQLAALHAVIGATPAEIIVQPAGQAAQTAHVYRASADMPELQPAVDLTSEQAELLCLACAEILSLADTHPVATLRARWPMALGHAASVLRARAEPELNTLRGHWSRADITLDRPSQPYAWYFGVREDDLRFRRFDGQMSVSVKRAGFVMSDAVTVLPYDPVRDRVMLIEQVRFGPWLRGVANAWSLEPIAGRVDPFESPVAAALREAQEEARLELSADQLHAVGNVYPSPAAITEFLYHYVALCDLPDGSDGIAGLATESEDIRSHLISYKQLMALVASGEVQNGPLVLTAWWLTAHRDALRAG